MLLLDRKKGTSTIIKVPKPGGDGFDEVRITVVDNGKYGVKLGFDAPRNYEIVREEINNR